VGLTYDRSGISAMLDDVWLDVGKTGDDVILDIRFTKL
jgi:hypothetical protein